MLLGENNLFDGSSPGGRDVHAKPTGRRHDGPELRARRRVWGITVPASWVSGPADLGLHITGRPGCAKKRIVRQERRASRCGLEFLTVVTTPAPRVRRTCRPSVRGLYTRPSGRSRPRTRFPSTASLSAALRATGAAQAGVGGERHTVAAADAFGVHGPGADPIRRRPDRPAARARHVCRRGLRSSRRLEAFGHDHRVYRDDRAFALNGGTGAAWVATGDLNGDRIRTSCWPIRSTTR